MSDIKIEGRNPVLEAMKADREIEKILVAKGNNQGSIIKIIGMAKDKNITIQYVDKNILDKQAETSANQGVMAIVSEYKYYELEDVVLEANRKGEDLFLIILDGIEDPHNLGAILRTADAVGAHGVIIPKNRAVGITGVVAKASAGAVEHVPVIKVTNLVSTMKTLKEIGVWIAASDMDGEVYHTQNLKGKIALVIGSEGKGVSRLVKQTCDFNVRIPMVGKISSLNASNAAAVLMYEVLRQKEGSYEK